MQGSRIHLFIAGVAAVAVLGAACGSDDPGTSSPASTEEAQTDAAAASGQSDVRIKDFVFVPGELSVTAGTTVTWTNDDFFGHTVTSGEPGAQTDTFDGVLGEVADAEGMGFEFTFDEPGTYPYFCRFHPRMRATITVTE